MRYKSKWELLLVILAIIISILTAHTSLVKGKFNEAGRGHWIYFNFRLKGEEAYIEVDIHINITDKPEIKP